MIRLQARFTSIAAIIIDEYSMVKSLDMYWVHRRLQQALKNDLPFGGIPICLVGDPGQLPPVGGLPLWSNRTSKGIQVSGNVLQGHLLYSGITTVMKLTDILRQQGLFQEICLRLRDGNLTNSDWVYLMEKCTEQNMTQEKINRFHSPACIWLYTTNEDNNKHNKIQLKKTNQPIALLEAKHDTLKSKQKSTESTRKLAAKLYLTRGSKIMLLWNVLLSVGLVNGATGIIIDFIYEENKNAPELPYAIIIQFNEYKGPRFFSGEGQEKWVPILTEEYKWGDPSKEDHYRIQFPICLAWALTVWKSQGLTIEGLLAFQLGESEKEHGISFVGLSRSTNIDNVSLCGGCSLERLTTKISGGTKLKLRLKEDARLDLLHAKTLQFFNL